MIHQYTAPGVSRDPFLFPNDYLPKTLEDAKNGQHFFFNDTEELNSEGPLLKEKFHRLNIKAALFIPYNMNGKATNAISFAFVRQMRTFTPDLIAELKIVGEIMVGAFYRMRLEESYQKLSQERGKHSGISTVEGITLKPETDEEFIYEHVIGQSPAMKQVFSRIEQVAATDSTVLVLGETGTGKGIIANVIHNLSLRKEKRRVTVNCAALHPNLIESELFGREKGAFTGATSRQIGRFELADQGTLILDEIGELPLELQAKLLRAIQDGEFERLGSPATIKVDVRVLALTGKNLQEEARQKRFRQDLFYRLNVFPITIPPLRERREDIPLLADYFLKEFNRKMCKEISAISPKTMEELKSYYWPGNVRELEHIIERSVIATKGNNLQLADKLDWQEMPVEEESFITNLAEVEKRHIIKVLEKANWRIEGSRGAALLLGLHPNTLRGRMQKLGIAIEKKLSEQ